jgi:hypothetical protein
MENQFPNAKFDVCIENDEVLSNQPMIFLKLEHKCYCYSEAPRDNIFLRVNNENGSIKISDLIAAMVEYEYDPMCNHTFLELFEKDTEFQFTAYFGS